VPPIDLTEPAGMVIGLLPEISLTAWSLVVMLVAGWRHRDEADRRLAGRLALAGLVTTLAIVLWYWVGDVRTSGTIAMMTADAFRFATDAVFLTGAILAVALSDGYLQRERIGVPEYYVLLLLATVGMMFMSGGTDLIVIFLGLELMSVGAYVLAGIDRRSAFGAEAALKYFLLGAFASGFFLYGIALLYGATGSTNLTVIHLQVTSLGLQNHVLLLAGTAMLLIGFGFKVAAVPFHMWAPDVYDGAPTPVTAYMAAAVKAAAFAALVRVLMSGLGELGASWGGMVAVLAAVTMIAGNLLALAQRRVKRLLAYSSVGHAGYLLVAVATGTELGGAAFLFYILVYTFMTVGAFAILAAAGRDGERDLTIDHLSGLARRRPWLAFAMAVFMLSLLGFPGTAGFMGKWYILSAAVEVEQYLLAVLLVGASVVSAGYYLPVIMAMYMKTPMSEVAHEATQVNGAARAVLVGATLVLLLFGVWPNRLLDLAERGAGGLRPALVIAEGE
jgi:NADH-quinone oxidoreductase subunit N